MAISDNDSKKIAQQILGALESLIRKNSRTVAGGTKPGRVTTKKSDDLNFDATKKSLKDLNKTVADITKEMEDLSAGTKGSTDKFKELAKSQTALFEGLINNESLSNKAQDSLLKRIKKNIDGQTLLGKQLGDSIDNIKDLGDALKKSTDYLSDYNSALEDAGASTLNEIKNKKKLSAAISKLADGSKEYSKIQNLLADGTRKSLDQAARLLDDEAKNSVKFRDSTLNTIRKFASLEVALDKMKAGIRSVANAFGAGWVKSMATGIGSLLLVISGAKDLSRQFWSISQIGLAGHFMDISKGSISLGIDLETFGKIIRRSNIAIGQLGFNEYKNVIKQNQMSLRSLGLTAANSAAGIAGFVDNALASGVDIRNQQDLDTAIKKQTDAFSTLAAITGESIDEFSRNNKQIFESSSFQKRFAALDKTRRKNMLLGIIAERKRLAIMGLSSESQLAIIKKTQEVLGADVTDRFAQSANLMQAAIVSGNASSASEIRSIFLKGDRASNPEKDRLANLLMKVNKDLNTKRVDGNLNQENIVNKVLKDNAGVLDVFTKANNEKDKNKLSKPELERRKAAQVVNTNIVKISQGVDQLQQILKNPLTRISAGVAGILFLLARKTGFGKNLLSKKKAAKTSDAVTQSRVKSTFVKPAKTSIPNANQGTFKQTMSGLKNTRVGRATSKTIGIADKLTFGLMSKSSAAVTSAAISLKNTTVDYKDSLKTAYSVAPEPVRRTNSRGNAIYYASADPITGKGVGKQISRAKFDKQKAENVKARTKIGTAKRAGNVAKTAVMKPMKGIGKVAGIVGKGAIKFLPVVGWAIAGMQAIKGAFDAVENAAAIFNVDTKTTSVTSSQKISAGIAGALSTLSFGLIPVEGTATILNSIANTSGEQIKELLTGAISSIGDLISTSMEFAVNGLVPALWSGFKWLLGNVVDNFIAVSGYIKEGIISIFNGDYFKKIFLGEGEGGVVSNIVRAFGKGIAFLGSSLIRGLTRVGLDAVGFIADLLGLGDKFKKLSKPLQDFASADVKFSDFDSVQEKHAREKANADKKQAKKLSAIRNKTNQSVDKIMKSSHTATVKSLKQASVKEASIIGMVSDFNVKLTKSQLRAQGVKSSKVKQSRDKLPFFATSKLDRVVTGKPVNISNTPSNYVEVRQPIGRTPITLPNINENKKTVIDTVKTTVKTTEKTTVNNNVADILKRTSEKGVGLSDVVEAINKLISIQEDELVLAKNTNEMNKLSSLNSSIYAHSASTSLDRKIV